MSDQHVITLLDKARGYKEKGNVLFKDKQFKKAISKYATVFAFTRGLPGSQRGKAGLPIPKDHIALNVDLETEAIELERICEQNIAICHLKLGNGKEALDHSGKAIALNTNAGKAHHLKAQALVLLKRYEGRYVCRIA
jgi:tetratricopeptide (TPR) repeat protein